MLVSLVACVAIPEMSTTDTSTTPDHDTLQGYFKLLDPVVPLAKIDLSAWEMMERN